MLRPFSRFCVTIGAIPESIIHSLSYEQQLLRLIKFLKTTVIPAIDGNTAAIQALEEWFDHIDIEEYVDNKLDEMVEDGTLEQIIGNALRIYKNTNLYGNNSEATLHLLSRTSDDIPVMPNTKSGVIDYNNYDNVGDGYIYDDREMDFGYKYIVSNTTNTTFTVEEDISADIKKDMYVLFYADSSYSTPLYLAKVVETNPVTNTITVDGFMNYSTKEVENPEGIHRCWINPLTRMYDHYDYIYIDKDVNHSIYQNEIYNYSNAGVFNGYAPTMRHGEGGVAFRARATSENSKWVTAFGFDGEGSCDNLLVNKTDVIVTGNSEYNQAKQTMTGTDSTAKTPVKKVLADTALDDLGYPNGSVFKIINARNIEIKLTGAFDNTSTITQFVLGKQESVIIAKYDDVYHVCSNNYIFKKQHIPTYAVNNLNYGFIPITSNLNIDTLGLEVGDVIMCIVQNGLTLSSSKTIKSNNYADGNSITVSHWTMGFIYRATEGSYWTSL